MYIILAIIVFGVLIATHELGHFLAAKACGVRVNEYAIGMGPAIFKKQRGETLYSLRCLPFGGYCAMEGEDGDSDDPRSFQVQAVWKRLIILFAGAAMNFLTGLIIAIILFSGASAFVTPEIVELADGFPDDGERGLMVGDTIRSINGERVWYSSDFTLLMGRTGDRPVDMIVIRDGERVRLDDYDLRAREYADSDGNVTVRYGVSFKVIKAGILERLRYSVYTACNFVRLVRFSLADLVHGAVGFKDISGPVGIVSVINDMGHSSLSVSAALSNIAFLCAFIAVNLAVMNLLPIPALDGGRIFLLVITWIIEKIIRRKIDPKYEGYIHAAGLVLLVGLMVVIMFSDVVKLFHG